MRLKSRLAEDRCPAGGFSLLEVVVAAALLLMTVTAVSAALTTLTRGSSRLTHAMDVDRVLRDETEYLRALPFCAPTYPSAAEEATVTGAPAADLVAEVFPHAVAADNREAARYVAVATPGDAPVGSFVTRVVRGGVAVERVARFVAPGAPPLMPDSVVGWAVWGSSSPPAPALEVHLVATAHGASRRCVFVCSALRPPLLGADEARERGGA